MRPTIRGRPMLLLLVPALVSCAARPEPAGPMAGVMRQKLDDARAALQGMVTGDDDLVARSADALYEASRSTEWMVQDTVTYGVLSDEFREVVAGLADAARARDAEAVGDAYAEMVRTCVRCHAYIRRERMMGDFPEKVSWLDRTGSR